eukprot:2530895-Rhodomonas_salina.1
MPHSVPCASLCTVCLTLYRAPHSVPYSVPCASLCTTPGTHAAAPAQPLTIYTYDVPPRPLPASVTRPRPPNRANSIAS